jgi:hypothetical protein
VNRQMRRRAERAARRNQMPAFAGPGAEAAPMPEALKHAAVNAAFAQQKLQKAQMRVSVTGLAVDSFERLLERRGPLTDDQKEMYEAVSEQHNLALDTLAELACELIVALDEVDAAQDARIIAPPTNVAQGSALQIVQ